MTGAEDGGMVAVLAVAAQVHSVIPGAEDREVVAVLAVAAQVRPS